MAAINGYINKHVEVMSPNRRILLNIIATYGRSLYALAIGLVTARWALQALGVSDYGVMGVVGGLAGFISFFNGILAAAVGRFYAISVGKASVKGCEAEGLIECRRWFSTAMFLHTLMPTVLMAIGYPIGVWAVRCFLSIPPDRVSDCVWVFRFVCVSCFISMVTVPVSAMYTAKQYIAELTIYSIITTTLNACFLYYMVTHPGVWLAKYAFWTALLSVLPNTIICLRGVCLFKECRIIPKYLLSWMQIKQLAYFVGMWTCGGVAWLLRVQGINILINKFFGVRVNAAMAIANNVDAHTKSLSGSMLGAFHPAITSAYGAGDLDRMRALAYRASKLSLLFILIFMLPLGLELEKVLQIWLKNPPEYVYGLCLMVFAVTITDQSTIGQMIAINTRGKILWPTVFQSGSLLMGFPLAWLFCWLGWGVYSVVAALLLSMACCSACRVWFARRFASMSGWYWVRRIFVPVVVGASISVAIGLIPRLFMVPSVGRIVIVGLLCDATFIILSWRVLLDVDEREFLIGRFESIYRNFRAKMK